MEIAPLAATAIATVAAATAMGVTLDQDAHHRLRTVDNGEYQHAMFAAGGIAGVAVLSTIGMAIAQGSGAPVLARGFAGSALGCGLGLVLATVGARLLRAPDSAVPHVEAPR